MERKQKMNFIEKLWNKFVNKRNIAYLSINIGNIPIMTLVSSFLAVYYINVLGMDEYSVGTMFLVARIFDGINDPFIGSVLDKIGGDKLSKFKRVLIIGTLICSLNYILLWIGPALVEKNFQLMTAYISYLLLGVTFPVMDISLNSLLPILSQNQDERDTLSSIKVIGYGIGTITIEIFVPIVLSLLGETKITYICIIIISTFLILILTVGGTIAIKNENTVLENSIEKTVNGLQAFLQVLKEKNIYSTFLSGICFYTGNAVLTVSNTYYATYYLGNIKYLAYITIATYSLEMFVILLLPYITQKYEKKLIFSSGLFLAGTGLLIRFISWNSIGLDLIALIVSSSIYGLGYGFVMILFYSIQADNVDKVFNNSKIQAEGTIASLMSMSNKIGKGIGGAIPLYVLGLMKTDAGTYTELSLRLIDGLIPSVLLIVGGVFFAKKYE